MTDHLESVVEARADRGSSRSARGFIASALLPAIVLITLVTLAPLAFGIFLSFTNYSLVDPTLSFVGLKNYQLMVGNPYVVEAMKNTFVFAGFGVVLETTLGLMFAVLLARQARGFSVLRLLYIVPLAVSPVAAAAAWKALFNTRAGWINYFLGTADLPQPNWLADPSTAMLSVLIADAWTGVSVVTIILLGGLLALSKDPTEAARIDGASELRILLWVTLPRIAPILGFAMAIRLFDLLRQFGLFQLMTGGGPGGATTVLNFYVYQETFAFGSLAYGAALGVTLTLLIVLPTVLVLLLVRRFGWI